MANQRPLTLIRFIFFLIFWTVLFPAFAHAKLETGSKAEIMLGQPDLVQVAANNGGRSASTMSGPHGIFTDGKRVFLTEVGNNRVLIWNSIPTAHGTPADVVLGQSGFTTGGAAGGQSGMNGPRGVFFDGRRLFVGDWDNHRLLIWNDVPAASNTLPDVVVGQPDFATVTTGTSAVKMGWVQDSFSDGKKLFAVDQFNNRVLIWNSIPTSNGAPADVAIGQPNLTTSSSGNGPGKMNGPVGLFFDGRRIVVSDHYNNRILIWNSVPTTNGVPADIVLGQPDFITTSSGGGRGKMNGPGKMFFDGKQLYVPDVSNHRFFVWNKFPTFSNALPDIVIGQSNFESVSAGDFQYPVGVALDGRNMFVTDYSNNRVHIFNIADTHARELGPQFTQGKALVGKVFYDLNGNDVQDEGERGIEGVKVATDTGIYAVTDEDGKYHFPYIETGQRLLKVDSATLEEGSAVTSDNPRRVTVTEGVLTKVSFGVAAGRVSRDGFVASDESSAPLLKVSLSQDPSKLSKNLSVSHALKSENAVEFTIECNYRLFIISSQLLLYDKNRELLKAIPLPNPMPFRHVVALEDVVSDPEETELFYQLRVNDQNGRVDATSLGKV